MLLRFLRQGRRGRGYTWPYLTCFIPFLTRVTVVTCIWGIGSACVCRGVGQCSVAAGGVVQVAGVSLRTSSQVDTTSCHGTRHKPGTRWSRPCLSQALHGSVLTQARHYTVQSLQTSLLWHKLGMTPNSQHIIQPTSTQGLSMTKTTQARCYTIQIPNQPGTIKATY